MNPKWEIHKNISVLITYSPHIGYPAETIKQYWEHVESYITLIPRKFSRLWRTDNNEKIIRNDTNTDNIAPWAIGGNLNNSNSITLSHCCEQNDWVAINTFLPLKIRINKISPRGIVMAENFLGK